MKAIVKKTYIILMVFFYLIVKLFSKWNETLNKIFIKDSGLFYCHWVLRKEDIAQTYFLVFIECSDEFYIMDNKAIRNSSFIFCPICRKDVVVTNNTP